jgi:hypothetical protein
LRKEAVASGVGGEQLDDLVAQSRIARARLIQENFTVAWVRDLRCRLK